MQQFCLYNKKNFEVRRDRIEGFILIIHCASECGEVATENGLFRTYRYIPKIVNRASSSYRFQKFSERAAKIYFREKHFTEKGDEIYMFDGVRSYSSLLSSFFIISRENDQ